MGLSKFLKYLGPIGKGISWTLKLTDPDTPLVVFDEPTEEQIERFVRQIFSDDELLREGVLISPLVYAKTGLAGKVVGYSVLLSVEGVGATPEAAVLSSRFVTGDEKISSLENVLQDTFGSKIDIIQDTSYERRRERERGIFFKVDQDGELIARGDYIDIPIQDLRDSADRQAEFLGALATEKEKNLTSDLSRRVRYYDELIRLNADNLIISGAMERISRAEKLHREAREHLNNAQREFRKAASYGRMAAAAQWIGFGLQAAGVLNSSFVKAQAQKELKGALEGMAGKLEGLEASVSDYNKKLGLLNAAINSSLNGAAALPNIPQEALDTFHVDMFSVFGLRVMDLEGNKFEFLYEEQFSDWKD